jgi:arylsulfatase A-like enzyme
VVPTAIARRTTLSRRAVAWLAALLVAALVPLANGYQRSQAVLPAPQGVWLVATDGGIFAHGDSGFYGSTGAIRLNQPISGMATTPSGRGYWLVASDGGIFSFGDAGFYGSTGAIRLNRPIVGMASTPSGRGYWLVASDGGIFAFGDARFLGSTGAMRLNRPIVGMAATPSGRGYWLVASDGGIFAFGDAGFYGSTGALRLNRPITGMASARTGRGYWLVASDGGAFNFGDAGFHGAAPAVPGGEREVVGLVPTTTGRGYWEATAAGEVLPFGDATVRAPARSLNKRVVGMAAMPPAALGGVITTPTTVDPVDHSTADIHKKRPNVVVVVMDDMREDGVMNEPAVLPRTKHWLAEGGTSFTEAYTTTPLCCPERATIWSGRLMHNHGVVDNYHGDLLDKDWIIPRYLNDAGYRTALLGKFITDWNFRYEIPHFQDYAAFQGGYEKVNFWVKDPGAKGHHYEHPAYSTDFIADKAVQYIDAYEAHDDQPFYLHVTPHAPHDNKTDESAECSAGILYDWPARHDDTPVPDWKPSPAVTAEGTPEGKSDKVPYLRDKTQPRQCSEATHNGHMKTLLAADEMVDRIMGELEAKGELDNTLVVFTTDNGYSWGERGVTSKGFPYTEHISAPFLVRWPGVFPAGAVDARPVGGEDFLPTLLEAADYRPPELHYALDGVSFLPGNPSRERKFLEFGPAGPSPADYGGHRGIPTWASFRTSTWQYIEYYEVDNTTIQFREYYDLVADPWELDNVLADGNPANDPDVPTLSAELDWARHCAGREGPGACW